MKRIFNTFSHHRSLLVNNIVQRRLFSTGVKRSVVKHKFLYGLCATVATTSAIVYYRSLETPAALPQDKREQVIILGTGWGGIAFLESLDLSKYNVVIVSPRNYSLFTPMLASVTTGHVDNRSIVDSIHDHIARHVKKYEKYNPKVEFYEAKCVDVDLDKQDIVCAPTNTQKYYATHIDDTPFNLKYDKLVVAVGCRTNTFGVSGVVENCYFLKEMDDAQGIRVQIWTNLERANCPNIPEEQLKKMLHFCIAGGGPTGIEFASELNDVLKGEVKKFFPHLVPYMKITVIQSADHILNSFDQKITEYVEKRFLTEGIRVITNSRVIKVTPDDIIIHDKTANRDYAMPYGMCLWSTGIMQHPLVETIAKKLDPQTHKKALEVDPYLRVVGISKENVFAIGDCSTVKYPECFAHMAELFTEGDLNKDGKLSLEELKILVEKKNREYPQFSAFANKLVEMFHKYDLNHDEYLQQNEFELLLKRVDSEMGPLPATAQCASQQGKYLARMFNRGDWGEHFRYNHLGQFAYLGQGQAVAQIGGYIGTGWQAWVAYKSVYWAKQVSHRNKVAIAGDWLRTLVFGRELSKV